MKTDIEGFRLAAEVKDSGFICLSGRNGSGKSCFLRSVAGLMRADESRVIAGGVNVGHLPPEKRGIVMVTPSSFLPHLRVDAHLTWGARRKKLLVPTERVREVKSILGIEGAGRVSSLSLGSRERVGLATALLASPSAILVDEAFSNLHERRKFISEYRKLTTDAGADVIFSTQDESEFQLSEHGYVISDGKTERRF